MNKNGFTLIELLATIVIIALLAGIGTFAYTSIIRQSADRVYESYEDILHAEAAYKLTMHPNDVVFSGGKARLTLSDLDVDLINNPDNPDDKCLGSYVDVTKSNVGNVLSIHYKVCLICTNHNSDGNNCRDYEN